MPITTKLNKKGTNRTGHNRTGQNRNETKGTGYRRWRQTAVLKDGKEEQLTAASGR
jgi:hypothetical protein